MEQTLYHIDGANFSDLAGLIAEFNRGYISHLGGEWNGNLDSFNDYLGWADDRCTIRWLNSGKSRTDLGHAATATWLSKKMADSSLPHNPDWRQRLADATNGVGPTFFD